MSQILFPWRRVTGVVFVEISSSHGFYTEQGKMIAHAVITHLLLHECQHEGLKWEVTEIASIKYTSSIYKPLLCQLIIDVVYLLFNFIY